MSVEELLKPRFKVIADWPGNDMYSVGDITKAGGYTAPFKGNFKTFSYDEYPHLFKPLSWWEERKEKDMPGYVKDEDNRVGKLSGERYKGGLKDCVIVYFPGYHSICAHFDNFLPATESEYLSFINSKNPPQLKSHE